jgi:hypothetical protein
VNPADVPSRCAVIGRLAAAVCALGAAVAALVALSIPSFNTSGGLDFNESDQFVSVSSGWESQ